MSYIKHKIKYVQSAKKKSFGRPPYYLLSLVPSCKHSSEVSQLEQFHSILWLLQGP